MKIKQVFSGKVGATLVCFLAYFIMSGLLTPIGIVSVGLQETYNIDVAQSTSIISWLLTGVLIGTCCSNFIFRWLNIKQVFFLCYSPLVVFIVLFSIAGDIQTIRMLMGASGFSIGLGLSTAAVALTRLYDPQLRASMLICTDINFSAAGAIIPAITALMFSYGMPWFSGYMVVGCVALFCLIVVMFRTFPSVYQEQGASQNSDKVDYRIWLLALAMFLFLVGQNTFSIWSPTYLVQVMGGNISDGGAVISQFWMFAVVGQILTIGILSKGVLSERTFLFITQAMVVLATWLLSTMTTIDNYLIFAAAYGFLSLGGYKTLISVGSQLSLSPKAITILLTGGTTGSMSAPAISTWVYNHFGIYQTIQLISLCAFGVFMCTSIVFYSSQAKRKTVKI